MPSHSDTKLITFLKLFTDFFLKGSDALSSFWSCITVVNYTGEACITGTYQRHRWCIHHRCCWYQPVINHNFVGVVETVLQASPVLMTPVKHASPMSSKLVMHHQKLWRFVRTFKGTISKKQAISISYFPIGSILYSQGSSNYNKTVCVAGNDNTSRASEKSNTSAIIFFFFKCEMVSMLAYWDLQ
jgi:hypothetical protein